MVYVLATPLTLNFHSTYSLATYCFSPDRHVVTSCLDARCLQVEFGLTILRFTDGRQNVTFVRGVPENGRFVSAAKVWCRKRQASYAEEGGLQGFSWQQFSSDSTLWWDGKLGKKTAQHVDSTHKKSKDALWLCNWCKPAWVESRLAPWDSRVDAGMGWPLGPVSIRVPGASGRVPAHEGALELGTCSKLCEDGLVTEAVDMLKLLAQRKCHIPDNLFYRLLKRCSAQKDLVLGRRIHALTVENGYESNPFLANHLICMYASYGSLMEAMEVFSKVSAPNSYMWASIILAYARHGQPTQALWLYRQMRKSTVKPDNHIFVAVLKACASARDLAAGKDVHAHILASAWKPDMYVQTCLVDMYAKCGSLEDAQRIFDRLAKKDVVTWTAMIAGYAQQGMGQEALGLYRSMQDEGITPPNSVTFVCLLQACASVGVAALQQGKQLNAQVEEKRLQDDVGVCNNLVNMYAKCGSLEDAKRVFEGLPRKDVVTWTAMIAGYTQEGRGQEALGLFSRMQQEGTSPPDAVTFVCLLQACANAAALPLGKQLHAQIEELGLQAVVAVGNSLVNMYAKCGSLEDAHQVFDSLSTREIMAWGALIAGYTRQGDSEVVFDLVDRMKLEGLQPDGITFLSVLTVCSHVGLVDKGKKYFEIMSTDYGVTPTVEHYACMMDLLGRAGHLDEALWMAKTMPLRPNGAVWHTLLAASRKWGDVEVGRQAFEFAVMLDEMDAAAYVLMSNIYVGAQMWEEGEEMQQRRKNSGAWKQPGQSWWTDTSGVVHGFVARDKEHPDSEGRYPRLENWALK